MSDWQQTKFTTLEHGEPITFSHYELHPLEVKKQPQNQEVRHELDRAVKAK